VSSGTPAETAGSHVVIAELEVRPERLGAFIELARSFAAECLAREPGCRQFQVVRLETTPQHVLFFEAYDDAAAFDAHRASDHLARFKATFQDMVKSERPLRQGRRAQEGS
jgi:quinol monooxygenase YgiN